MAQCQGGELLLYIGLGDSCSKMSCVIKHTHTQRSLNWDPGSSGLSLNIQLMPVLHQKNIQASAKLPALCSKGSSLMEDVSASV